MKGKTETATFGAGCFWCVEAVFAELKGVSEVLPGYMGGKVKNPTYKEVCSGLTGHAEVAQITFDPDVISYKELLEVFWMTHDPTTLNRQGADVGTQYRSGIYYHNEKQQQIANSVIKDLEQVAIFDAPIVTEVKPATTFYPAEAIHQGYAKNNPNQPYCVYLITPKLTSFRKKFQKLLKVSQ